MDNKTKKIIGGIIAAVTFFASFEGITIFGFSIGPINFNPAPPEKEDIEQKDHDKYNRALEMMSNEKYSDAINNFISIKSSYSNIENVKKNLMNCVVLYVNDIKIEVDNLVYSSTSESEAYTNAIGTINKGIDYVNSLDNGDNELNQILAEQKSYVQSLIRIYDYRKDNKPFDALYELKMSQALFTDKPFLSDLNETIKQECIDYLKKELNTLKKEKQWLEIIYTIDNIDNEFYNHFIDEREAALNEYWYQLKSDVNKAIKEKRYSDAKEALETSYTYLSKNNDFMKLYNEWHSYSPNLLIYQTITIPDSASVKAVEDINGNQYSKVVSIYKYSSDKIVEFSLNNDYSSFSGTFFLTNSNYKIEKELSNISVRIEDDMGNLLGEYDNITYKTPVSFSTQLTNSNYIRLIVKGNTKSNICLAIRDGIFS